MKKALSICLLFFSFATYSKGLTIVDTKISDKKFKVIVVNSRQINFYWGRQKRTLNVRDSTFSQDITDYKNSRIIEYQKKNIKLNNSIYVLDDSDVFVVFPGTNSNVCLAGLKLKNDSIIFWNSNYATDFEYNKLVFIAAPSILILKQVTGAEILFGSKNLYMDINNSMPVVCSFVTVLDAESDGHFYLEMKYPVILNTNNIYDIWDDDIKYYKKIISMKVIENPFDLFTKTR